MLIYTEDQDLLASSAREVLDAEEIEALIRGESLPEKPSTTDTDPSEHPETTETVESAADETAEGPSGLPQPGNQPA